MRSIFAGIILLVLGSAATAAAELDLEKEVLIIPDTHNEKPYIWNVERQPRGYELVLSEAPAAAGGGHSYIIRIVSSSETPKGDVHVFITDNDLHLYAHRKAVRSGEDYRFEYEAPGPGKYRLEVVFETRKGWVNLRKDIKIGRSSARSAPDNRLGDEDYQVRLKLIPKKAYAEHVVTFLYEIEYKGAPLTGLEKMDGFDMHVAAWDEDLKEFLYATPRQNMGGPEVAVSIVFMRPGKHAVFTEFKHNGIVRQVDSVILVNREYLHDAGAIENLRPAD